ncbi:MAG: alpha-amylase family glycosyl hydrolase, partial [Gammaproteobacteria bacterium]
GFYQYKYFVTYEDGTSRWCGDPCTKYVATEHENAAFVIGGPTTTVEPIGERTPFQNLIIYELMIDDFTANFREGLAQTDAIKNKIDYLTGLGINTIEFMPWTAWRGGDFSWGYNPFLFFAVENRYIEDPNNPLDRLHRFKTLINELHSKNIHVVMDGVFNHVDAGLNPGRGFPYHWLYQNPIESPYTGGFAGAGYFEELDYNNLCTQQFIFDVCKYWLDTYQVDGIRFDYTLGFYAPGDSERGISKLIADLNDHFGQTERDKVPLMLEHLTDNRYQAIGDTNQIDASGCWYDRFLFDVPQQAINGELNTKLIRVLDTGRDFAPGKGPVTYIENHDHSTLVNRAGGRERWWKAQVPLIALLTSPGAVLIHNGQEFGEDYWLPGSGSGRVQSRPLHWEFLDDTAGQWLLALHRKLIQLRKTHPSLCSHNYYPRYYDEGMTAFNDQGYGVDESRNIAIYHRWGNAVDGALERFIIVLNFSDYDQRVDVPLSTNGVWHELLNGGEYHVENYRLQHHLINSNWGKVFYRKG